MSEVYGQRSCAFCGRGYRLGEGILLIRNDGSTYWFCSSKCRKSLVDMKRDYRKVKWARKRREEFKA